MYYSLSKNLKKGEFAVPSIVVDHLRIVNENQLKVLLLILGKAPRNLTIKQIAKALMLDVETAETCLQYWVLTGVLTQSETPAEPTKFKEEKTEEKAEAKPQEPKKFVPKSQTEKAEEKAENPQASEQKAEIEYSRPSSSEIATRMDESPEIATLFRELQAKLGKTIGYDGQCTFLLLYDRFGLSAEVIFMLVDYCVSVNKTGYSYIEAVGKDWANQEIDTIEKAAEKISSLNTINSFWKKFVAATGVNNPKPTSTQLKFLELWVVEWKMSFDLIILAYEKMTENTGKLNFKYMNKILMDWHEKKYKTVNDVEVAEKAHTDAKKVTSGASSEASYSIDEYQDTKAYKKPEYKRKYV